MSIRGILVIVVTAVIVRTKALPYIFGKTEDEPNQPTYKNFSGIRAFNRSSRYAYYHDQTIGVVELGPNRLLLNCELIETYSADIKDMVHGQIHKFTKPHLISFDQMMDLMGRCARIDTPPEAKRFTTPSKPEGRSSSSLFSGVIPGTKWCGTGDIAQSYFDLGEDEAIDKCCRNHDLCPTKVRSHDTRDNVTNDSSYTMSHCKCDAELQKCLRQTMSSTADIMGHFYYDILKIRCLHDTDQESVKVIGFSSSYAQQ